MVYIQVFGIERSKVLTTNLYVASIEIAGIPGKLLIVRSPTIDKTRKSPSLIIALSNNFMEVKKNDTGIN
jgi:hypothetical protein